MSSVGLSDPRTRLQRRDQIGQAFEGEVFAVQGNEHGVGGDQRVQRQQAQAGRTVDEDAVVPAAERLEKAPEAELALRQAHQFDLGAGELAIGRDGEHVVHRRRQDEALRRPPDRGW